MIYRHAQIYVTRRCTHACPQCAARHRISEADGWGADLSWHDLCKIIWRMEVLHVHVETLGFTGGEPTLWPNLQKAADYAKMHGVCDAIRVYSNGIGCTAESYAGADQVWVTHYGAVNSADIHRLRGELGRRLSVGWLSHKHPDAVAPYTLRPRSCPCLMYICCGDSVYPCGWAALRGHRQYAVPIAGDFVKQLAAIDPLDQSICATCPYNQPKPPITIEWQIGRYHRLQLPDWLSHAIRSTRALLRRKRD
jgi:hypothetical protein